MLFNLQFWLLIIRSIYVWNILSASPVISALNLSTAAAAHLQTERRQKSI